MLSTEGFSTLKKVYYRTRLIFYESLLTGTDKSVRSLH